MVTYLNEERVKLQLEAREFAMQEVLPVANELDRQKADIPRDLIKKMGEKGYFGILMPKEWGGLGLGVFEYILVTEELSKAWMSSASVIARANGMGAGNLTDEERRLMAQGEFIGAFALSEPEVGSDVAGITCRAEQDGDEWVLNGEKKWVGWAKAADFILLFARTQPVDPNQRYMGISSFFIRKERDSFPEGIEAWPIDKIGYYGITTWGLRLNNFRLPAQSLVGGQRREGGAFRAAVMGLNVARVHTAARAIGAAQAAFDVALQYAKDRKQFGRPIGDFQAIRFKISEMATEIEAARRLMYWVAEEIDQGGVHDVEASMAKLFASEMAERVTSEALQILGGAGYTTDYTVERHWRDARLTKIFEGTSEIQKRIISDRFLGRAGR